MKNIVRYQNGNYTVTIDLATGTKVRENDLDFLQPDFPESMDIKITNQCDMGCLMCHEDSKPDGKHADILSVSFIDTLHPYMELAIGGGNPLAHPDLIPFLEKCKKLQLIPSMTVNQKHFEDNIDYIKSLVDNKLIYGLGVSLTNATDKFISEINQFPNAVIHLINGIHSISQIEKLKNNGLKVLILGYKEFRRGEKLYSNVESHKAIDVAKSDLYETLAEIIHNNWFSVVSFDNLAIKQLNPKRLMSKEKWDEMYMGDDGFCTMFIDMVEKQFAKSSTEVDRYHIKDNIKDMFDVVKIK